MTLEFMTGATVFALINFVFFAFTVYLVYRAVRKIYKFLNDDSEEKTLSLWFETGTLILVGSFQVFFGSVTQPKMSLNPLDNRDLIKYQSIEQEITIETPEPRTEILEGFEPLKKD